MHTLKRAIVGAALSLSALSSCQKSFHSSLEVDPDQSGIIGGQAVSANDPASKVLVWILLRAPDGKSEACSGTIISTDFILTAAHCFQDVGNNRIEPLRIFAGNGLEFSPQGVYLHPSYTDKVRFNRYDIALLKYQSAVPTDIALMPSAGEFPVASSGYFVAGFGRTDADVQVSKPALFKLPSTVTIPELTDSEMVVFNSETTGTCYGDSGGPFYSVENGKVKVFSVLSRGAPGSDGCVGSDIQTRVGPVLDWVQQVLTGQLGPSDSTNKFGPPMLGLRTWNSN